MNYKHNKNTTAILNILVEFLILNSKYYYFLFVFVYLLWQEEEKSHTRLVYYNHEHSAIEIGGVIWGRLALDDFQKQPDGPVPGGFRLTIILFIITQEHTYIFIGKYYFV